jgi:hypothetical protein
MRRSSSSPPARCARPACSRKAAFARRISASICTCIRRARSARQFDEPIESWHGAMQTALCDRFGRKMSDDGFGATIEAAPSHPGLMAQAMPWIGRDAHADC